MDTTRGLQKKLAGGGRAQRAVARLVAFALTLLMTFAMAPRLAWAENLTLEAMQISGEDDTAYAITEGTKNTYSGASYEEQLSLFCTNASSGCTLTVDIPSGEEVTLARTISIGTDSLTIDLNGHTINTGTASDSSGELRGFEIETNIEVHFCDTSASGEGVITGKNTIFYNTGKLHIKDCAVKFDGTGAGTCVYNAKSGSGNQGTWLEGSATISVAGEGGSAYCLVNDEKGSFEIEPGAKVTSSASVYAVLNYEASVRVRGSISGANGAIRVLGSNGNNVCRVESTGKVICTGSASTIEVLAGQDTVTGHNASSNSSLTVRGAVSNTGTGAAIHAQTTGTTYQASVIVNSADASISSAQSYGIHAESSSGAKPTTVTISGTPTFDAPTAIFVGTDDDALIAAATAPTDESKVMISGAPVMSANTNYLAVGGDVANGKTATDAGIVITSADFATSDAAKTRDTSAIVKNVVNKDDGTSVTSYAVTLAISKYPVLKNSLTYTLRADNEELSQQGLIEAVRAGTKSYADATKDLNGVRTELAGSELSDYISTATPVDVGSGKTYDYIWKTVNPVTYAGTYGEAFEALTIWPIGDNARCLKTVRKDSDGAWVIDSSINVDVTVAQRPLSGDDVVTVNGSKANPLELASFTYSGSVYTPASPSVKVDTYVAEAARKGYETVYEKRDSTDAGAYNGEVKPIASTDIANYGVAGYTAPENGSNFTGSRTLSYTIMPAGFTARLLIDSADEPSYQGVAVQPSKLTVRIETVNHDSWDVDAGGYTDAAATASSSAAGLARYYSSGQGASSAGALVGSKVGYAGNVNVSDNSTATVMLLPDASTDLLTVSDASGGASKQIKLSNYRRKDDDETLVSDAKEGIGLLMVRGGFNIHKAKATLTLASIDGPFTYDGTEKKPSTTPALSAALEPDLADDGTVASGLGLSRTGDSGPYALASDRYTVDYENATNASVNGAYATASLTDDERAALAANFDVTDAAPVSYSISPAWFTVSVIVGAEPSYTGAAVEPGALQVCITTQNNDSWYVTGTGYTTEASVAATAARGLGRYFASGQDADAASDLVKGLVGSAHNVNVADDSTVTVMLTPESSSNLLIVSGDADATSTESINLSNYVRKADDPSLVSGAATGIGQLLAWTDFDIKPLEATFSLDDVEDSFVYDGTAHTPEPKLRVTLSPHQLATPALSTYSLTADADSYVLTKSDATYALEYGNNVNATTAASKASVAAKLTDSYLTSLAGTSGQPGNFDVAAEDDALTKQFDIAKAKATLSLAKITESFTYDGQPKQPRPALSVALEPNLADGGTVATGLGLSQTATAGTYTLATDRYDFNYDNNVNATKSGESAYAVATLRDVAQVAFAQNYTVTPEQPRAPFTIGKASMRLAVTAPDAVTFVGTDADPQQGKPQTPGPKKVEVVDLMDTAYDITAQTDAYETSNYENNTNVTGSASFQVSVTGLPDTVPAEIRNNYGPPTSPQTVTFEIKPADTRLRLDAPYPDGVTSYDGEPKGRELSVALQLGERDFAELGSPDLYTASYERWDAGTGTWVPVGDPDSNEGKLALSNVGKIRVSVSAKDTTVNADQGVLNYRMPEPVSAEFEIKPVGYRMWLAAIDDVDYDGEAHTPDVAVYVSFGQGSLSTMADTPLDASDYEEPVFENNLNAGTASVSVTLKREYAERQGIGTNYLRAMEDGRGDATDMTATTTFKINPLRLALRMDAIDRVRYDGSAKTPEPAVYITLGPAAEARLDPADYALSYDDNTAVGQARVTATLTPAYVDDHTIGLNYLGPTAVSGSFEIYDEAAPAAKAEPAMPTMGDLANRPLTVGLALLGVAVVAAGAWARRRPQRLAATSASARRATPRVDETRRATGPTAHRRPHCR